LRKLFSPGRYYRPRLKVVHPMRLRAATWRPFGPVHHGTRTKDSLYHRIVSTDYTTGAKGPYEAVLKAVLH
jgi:hypothetical protein